MPGPLPLPSRRSRRRLGAVLAASVALLAGFLAEPATSAAARPTPPAFSPATAVAGETLTVASRLPGGRSRIGVLQERTGTGGWRALDRARSDAAGRVRFRMRAHDAVLRVLAPAGGGLTSSVSRPVAYAPRVPQGVLVSHLPTGEAPSRGAASPSISADGRYVAFTSGADDLVTGDGNGLDDAFLYDRADGSIEQISNNGVIGSADGRSAALAISADGSFVVFRSAATNLVPGDSNGREDVFVWERDPAGGGAVVLVSATPSGAPGDDASSEADISPDGRYVAFSSIADDLVAGVSDTNARTDVFLRDLQTGRTRLVSRRPGKGPGNDSSFAPSVSRNGARVAYTTAATDLVRGARASGRVQVLWWERRNGSQHLVSGRRGRVGDESSSYPSIDDAGRRVAFATEASDLVPGTRIRPGQTNVVLATLGRRATTSIRLVSGASGRGYGGFYPVLDPTGRYVAFTTASRSRALPGPHTSGGNETYVRRLDTGLVSRISLTPAGFEADGDSAALGLSSGARYVAVETYASDLTRSTDTNANSDVVLVDRRAKRP
ncbi:hypothetical protein GCM10022215_01590 [Nocardioides fonticola]|uniref:WD40 repeat protein n=1 Tax=Nocardioides fonticola TaxID=450363 RepID=A0ABP7X997_9ACTN